ncbi:dihydrolipoamide acetyltransferase family protein [Leucobacter sp. BZR 635]
MTPQVFRLPDLGEGLTEAVLIRWAVALGDEITVDQVIAEVETAKSIVDLPSPFAGRVVALHGEEGGSILTGAPVIEVGTADGLRPSTAEQEAYRAEEQAGSGNVLIGYGTGAGPVRGRRRRVGGGAVASPPPSPSPSPPKRATSAHAIPAAPAAQPIPPAPAAPAQSTPRGPVAVRSPIVRRLARELGVDPAHVTPTGSDGAVTRSDILRSAGGAPDAAAEVRDPASTAPEPAAPLRVLRTERFSPLRRAVSAKLSRSRAEIPEATVWVDADLTELWELRGAMAPAGQDPPSVTAIFARYVLLALEQFPLLASRIVGDGDEFECYDGVNLGIAVDTDRGLMVPVIPHANALSIADINSALRDLAAAARAGRIAPAQLRDSTFTVNNYGGLGVDGSAAIINHPEVAILGIGRILERPWVVAGEIVPRRIAQLSLVFDHRVCDGGYAAGFLRAVVELLEHPLRAYPRV